MLRFLKRSVTAGVVATQPGRARDTVPYNRHRSENREACSLQRRAKRVAPEPTDSLPYRSGHALLHYAARR